MRKRRKVAIATIIALLAIIVMSVTVLAVVDSYEVTTPSRVTVVAAEPEWKIGIYEDVACTLPVTLIDWGEIGQGATQTMTVYVKAEGTVGVEVTVAAEALTEGTLTGDTLILAVPGDCGAFEMELTISPTASQVLDTFHSVFTATAIP